MNVNPIFVVGSARNGTTSLSNYLATSSEIYGVAHWLHYGQLESNLCGFNLKYSKDGSFDCQTFLAEFIEGDYFLLTGQHPKKYSGRPFRNVYDFYFQLMDDAAKENRASYWVTKIDSLFSIHPAQFSLLVQELSFRYERPKFIAIQREPVPTLLSYLNMEGARSNTRKKWLPKIAATVLEACRYSSFYDLWLPKLREVFPNTFFMSFTQFIQNDQVIMAKLVACLGQFDNAFSAAEINYSRNTSAPDGKKAKHGFFFFLAKFLLLLIRPFPLLAAFFFHLYYRFYGRSPQVYHRVSDLQNNQKRLIEHLQQRNAYVLLDQYYKLRDGK
ncbi:hypothetical protein CEQ90_06620 [Lewinellaceae bacterium SD302]|nr:hypothetical protein CEQ90_06620 [Lewinellaceae bacterium SD302]